jgi:hypothetical protein
VCREWPLNSYEIKKVDALIFSIKASSLLPEIAKMFKILPHIEEFHKEDDTWQLGEILVPEQKPATVYLTLKVWNHEVMDLIFRLNCEERRPYILLVTSRNVIHGTSDKVLKDMGSAFVPLNEVIDFNADTEFELIRECNLPQLITPPTVEAEPESENIFRKCGDAWEVRFNRGEKFMLTGAETGARYLHFMLARPNEITPIMEIIRKVSGESENVMSADRLEDGILTEGYSFGQLPDSVTDNIADDKALKQYKQEMDQIKHDIEVAKLAGDNITLEQLEGDLKIFIDKINEIINPIGRKKSFANSRKNVLDAMRKTMILTISKIGQFQPLLAEHLRISIKYGQLSGYLTGYKISWDL